MVRRAAATLLLCAGLLSAGWGTDARAVSDADISAARVRQAQLDQVRSQLGDQVAASLAEQDQLAAKLSANRSRQEQLIAQTADGRARVQALDVRIATLDGQVAETERRIGVERAQVKGLARAIYVQPDSLLLQLAESRGLTDFVSRVADLASAAGRARSLKDSLKKDEGQLQSDRERQRAARREQADAVAGLQDQLGQLRSLESQQEASQAVLDAKLAQTRAELSRATSQSAATAQWIASALQEQQNELAAAASQSLWGRLQLAGGGSTGGPVPHLSDPLPGAVVTQPFGPTSFAAEPPYDGYPHFHTGIDLSAAAGTPVLAAADGTVALSGYDSGGYGNYVVLQHAGGIATLYGHLQQALVQAGQQVHPGDRVGLEGSTGNSTGPHLHFEVRRSGTPVDPAPFLAG